MQNPAWGRLPASYCSSSCEVHRPGTREETLFAEGRHGCEPAHSVAEYPRAPTSFLLSQPGFLSAKRRKPSPIFQYLPEVCETGQADPTLTVPGLWWILNRTALKEWKVCRPCLPKVHTSTFTCPQTVDPSSLCHKTFLPFLGSTSYLPLKTLLTFTKLLALNPLLNTELKYICRERLFYNTKNEVFKW